MLRERVPARTFCLLFLLTCLPRLGGGWLHAEEAEIPEEPHSHDEPSGKDELAPRLSLHGFADVSFSSGQFKSDSGEADSRDTFSLGQMDLYLVSHLAENISFLGEVVFEAGTDETGDQSTVVDVERLVLKYTVSDRLWVAIGRHHTPLGYWNESFHHGLYLQPNAFRPQVVRFEDDGGLVPVHTVGIDAGGRWFRGAWGLDYAGGVSNTRGPSSDEVQTTLDANDQKALTLRLTASHEAAGRLLFGVTVHHDYIPPNPQVSGREGKIEEEILGGHLVYRNDRLEFLSEYYDIRHRDQTTTVAYDGRGYFGIGVWRMGKWSPYAGYDAIRVDPDDLFYAGAAQTLRRALAGVRWDLRPFNALKFEYHHDSEPGVTGNVLMCQASFQF